MNDEAQWEDSEESTDEEAGEDISWITDDDPADRDGPPLTGSVLDAAPISRAITRVGVEDEQVIALITMCRDLRQTWGDADEVIARKMEDIEQTLELIFREIKRRPEVVVLRMIRALPSGPDKLAKLAEVRAALDRFEADLHARILGGTE